MFCILKIEKLENLWIYKGSNHDVINLALKKGLDVYRVEFLHKAKGNGVSIFAANPAMIEDSTLHIGRLAAFALPEAEEV